MYTSSMETIAEFIGFCRQGLHGTGLQSAGLPLALFLAGLAGSLVHCIGMCGPFVLGQVIADSERTTGNYGEWQRLAGAALLPYHFGRLTTYTALGFVAGGATALFAATTGFAWLSAALLALAAVLLLLQALGLALGARSPWSSVVARLAAPLSSSHQPASRFALGLVLGLLPCGLLYGALAAAAGTGGVQDGALAMLAFGLGTVPALVATAWAGLLVRRRLQAVRQWIAAPLLMANAVLMLALASQRL
jgi:sulfite exporter TauE/SafE